MSVDLKRTELTNNYPSSCGCDPGIFRKIGNVQSVDIFVNPVDINATS